MEIHYQSFKRHCFFNIALENKTNTFWMRIKSSFFGLRNLRHCGSSPNTIEEINDYVREHGSWGSPPYRWWWSCLSRSKQPQLHHHFKKKMKARLLTSKSFPTPGINTLLNLGLKLSYRPCNEIEVMEKNSVECQTYQWAYHAPRLPSLTLIYQSFIMPSRFQRQIWIQKG